MQDKKVLKNKKRDSEKIRLQPPNIFSIPRPYEDDYERNVAWYKKMKRIELKLRELKRNFSEISLRQRIRNEKTKEIIHVSKELINNFLIYKTRD